MTNRRLSLISLIFGASLLLGALHADPTAPSPLPLPPAQARYSVEVAEPDSKLTSVKINFPTPAWSNTLFRVFTDTGQPVGADFFMVEPNSPTQLIFDSSSGAKHYDIFIGPNWAPVHLTDTHAGVWLETRAGDGQPVDNLNQMIQKWNTGALMGRSLLNSIFEGGNRFGIEQNLLLHFTGWFENTQAEHLAIMTVSTDASFILIDGKEVVEWPGHHHFGDGMQGKYQGQVNVPPGTHSLEYYNAFTSVRDGWPTLACVAIKGGPFANWTMLTPESHFFKPVSNAHVVDYEAKPNGYAGVNVPPCSFEYSVAQQSVVAPDKDSVAFVTLSFTAFPTSAGTFTWTFDDGTTAAGSTVSHTFLRPGNRTVQVVVKDPSQRILGAVQQTIRVHLDWNRLARDQPHLEPSERQDALSYDFTKLSTSDLADCVNLFTTYQDQDGLIQVLPALIPKMNDVAPGDLLAEQDAAYQLDDTQPDHEKLCTDLLAALIARCSGQDSSPQMKTVANQSRLEMAQIILPKTEQLDPVKSLLESIDPAALSDFQRRALAILRADLDLAQGNIDAARHQYQALCTTPFHGDERSSVRQTGEVGQARAFMRQNELHGAEDALNDVLTWAPTAKLSSDWALARLYLYRQENQPLKAFIWGKRLLPVVTDSSRSELLYQVAEMAFAQSDESLGRRCVQELVTKHPYAEETAKARLNWPEDR